MSSDEFMTVHDHQRKSAAELGTLLHHLEKRGSQHGRTLGAVRKCSWRPCQCHVCRERRKVWKEAAAK